MGREEGDLQDQRQDSKDHQHNSVRHSKERRQVHDGRGSRGARSPRPPPVPPRAQPVAMRVALTYNQKKETGEAKALPPDFYAECDEPETVNAVRDAIEERHGEVSMIEADEDAFEKLRRTRPDIVFNMAEGLWGESREAQIPAMLEMLRIPYTGSNPLTLGLCLNKARAKEVLAYYGIPTARFMVAAKPSLEIEKYLSFPMIVKPLFEGSSKGIKNDSIVKTSAELRNKVTSVLGEYAQPALVEEYLSGREFTVALIGNGERLNVLPIVEINY